MAGKRITVRVLGNPDDIAAAMDDAAIGCIQRELNRHRPAERGRILDMIQSRYVTQH